jgi:CRISPR-associated protein Csa3
MDSYINENLPSNSEVIDTVLNDSIIIDSPKENNMGKKVLIATVYHPEPVLLASTRLGPERLILLASKDSDKTQEASVKLIQESLGKVIDVKVIKIDLYNIVEIAKKCVEIIDMQPSEDDIYVNITSGRKTQAMGLLFSAYARHDRVKKIAYNPKEDKNNAIVYLPRLSFKMTDSQKKILEEIGNKKYNSIGDLAQKIELSTAMLYRAIDELKDMDLVSTENGIELTDAGKIARL